MNTDKPRHNGKVERSHRKDNEYFYAVHKFYSFDDFKRQLAVHGRKYNNSLCGLLIGILPLIIFKPS